MKNYICLLIFLGFCINNDKVFIDGLNRVYEKDKNLEFTIVNKSYETNNYFISVEFNDGQWKEIIYTIYDRNSKSSLTKIIRPNQKIKVKIPINKIFYKNQLDFKEYRLKMFYGKKTPNKIYYSNSFKIK